MSEKGLYRQKYHAQLDELKADVEKLKAQASVAGANVKIELEQKISRLEDQMRIVQTKLSRLSFSGVRAWKSFKKGTGSVWCFFKRIFKGSENKSK